MTNRSTGDEQLPYAARDSKSVPGHWLLARLGKKVLRPGGIALTKNLLSNTKIADADVVELAPGLGKTAVEIMSLNPRSYIGIDQDPDAVRIVNSLVKGHVEQASADQTGLPDQCANVVVGEAMLTMQSDRGKKAIVSETHRILRTGGQYAIHELGISNDNMSSTDKAQIQKDLARAIKVNARPMTKAEWSALLEDEGFCIDWIGTAPMSLLEMRRNIQDEGIFGTLKIIKNVILDSDMRSRVMTMRKTFRIYRNDINAIGIVAHKV